MRQEKRFMTIAYRSLFLLLFIAQTACSRSTLTTVWADKDYGKGPVSSVMVVGVSSDEKVRQLFEEHFVELFEERSTEAVPSFKSIPKSSKASKEAVEDTVRRRGIQSIFVTRMVGIDKEVAYIEDPVVDSHAARYNRRFDSYYPEAYGSAATAVTYTFYKLESNLYDSESGALIWSARSKLFAPGTTDDALEELGDLVMNDLYKRGYVKSSSK